MAGISQGVPRDEVVPTLARNASLYGYQGSRQTEYLLLVDRYLQQARRLQKLAGEDGTIRVAGCDEAARLIQALGYKFQRPCKAGDAALVTENAERAFLTIDSGFPLTMLEQDLATNRPFVYSYPSTRVPILFREKDWSAATPASNRVGGSLLDELLHDQDLDRLYAALANCDQETRVALLRSPGLRRLAGLASVFDLYGREISIRSGTAVVPAGAERAWEELVGVSPRSAGSFVFRLLSKDNGWLAAYFDVLSRLNQEQQGHFADPARLKHLYSAYFSTATTNNAAHGVFPKNAELLVLLTSLTWDSNGDPEVPGGIAVWREILSGKAKLPMLRSSLRRTHCCDRPDGLLEMLVAASNFEVDGGPTQTYLMLAAINAGRPRERSLSDSTELLLATRLPQFRRWFPMFAEFPELDENSIVQFVTIADRIEGISNTTLRANALGAFQAEVGLWQIFARQGQIPKEKLNASFQQTLQPYAGVNSSVQLFDAARSSLKSILQATCGNGDLTQDQIVDLLAGPSQDSREGQRVHNEIAARLRSVLQDQRLASLDALFGLYDGLGEMAHGQATGSSLLPLADSLREFEMPRPIFTGNERTSWAPIVYTSRHAELQVRTDLTKILRSQPSPAQLESTRAQLTPFLRDTLVGLNYAYYEPPGAEVLHNNPLFVRSHDFSSISVQGLKYVWGDPELVGIGATAGGGAYLLGSLADLPYALASTEAEFIAPKNIQALIWKEVVPELLVSAILPRWWAVTQNELHAASLYQRAGEEILAAASSSPALRDEVMQVLSDRMSPLELDRLKQSLQNPKDAKTAASETLPSDTFYVAAELRRRHPDDASNWGPAAKELDELSRKAPSECSPSRISADFGVPHPTVALTNAPSVLKMKPVAAYGGNAAGLMAESWESNNLFWARLADENGYSPVMLNLLVPTLTRRMVVNIFGSNIDDLPALARAMRETGDEFRHGKIVSDVAQTVAQQ